MTLTSTQNCGYCEHITPLRSDQSGENSQVLAAEIFVSHFIATSYYALAKTQRAQRKTGKVYLPV